jgi:pyruvate kinase
MLRKTKLICTIGPASKSQVVINKLVQAGMNVARLNFSHGTPEEHIETIKIIRDVSSALEVTVAILLDLPGPKLRTGLLEKEEFYLQEGDDFSLTDDRALGNEHRVSVNFPEFFTDVSVEDTIFLNDGAIQLKVVSATINEVKCRVIVGGLLTANRGINIPGVALSTPSITDEDFKNLMFGVEQGVDYLAISFIRSSTDILDRRRFLQGKGANVPLIAKIEKHEAVADIDAIIAEADGVMVARGDLGIEIPLEEVPILQKQIIRKCNHTGKPVIVATQMLESMISAIRPTRAEVSDIANAIFDGTDAVMLSGETAIGKYPIQTVEMMAKIVAETENVLPYERILSEKGEQVTAHTDDAISYAACNLSNRLGASYILAYTSSGSTAMRVSRYRPKAPILALTPNANVARRLILNWGIQPYLADEPANIEDMFRDAARLALRTGIASRGDLVVITAGIPIRTPGSTNVVKVQRVE